MLVNSGKKNKIDLNDYDYQTDINNRALMSSFTILDVDVLEEVLNSSLKTSVFEIATNLDEQASAVLPSLYKLQSLSLLKVEGDLVLVDKETRKYYDSQIDKFDENFKPGMEFFQTLLKKVPIHVLPLWYQIPKNSDNIFESLVEKYLLYPQTFQRFLEEFKFENPRLGAIIDDVYNSTELKLSSHDIREKYNLSKPEFEELLLYLEFNCICCLRYQRVGKSWKEVVTPFYEWSCYLKYLNSSKLKSIKDEDEIEKFLIKGHSFIDGMSKLIEYATQNELKISGKKLFQLDEKSFLGLKNYFDIKNNSDVLIRAYFERIITRIVQMRFAIVNANKLVIQDSVKNWLKMNKNQCISYILKHPRYEFLNYNVPLNLLTARNHRHIENSLEGLEGFGWIYFDDYMQTMTKQIGNTDPVMLKQRGKNWEYVIPSYSEDEFNYIKATIFEKIFEAGLVEIGKHQGKDCFRVLKRV